MGRAPCCDKANVKKGPWSPEEDAKLKAYIEQHGTGGNWIALPQKIGIKRCGKSCRLRWLNYLRPNIKHGGFSEEEDNIICSLYINIGSRWSIIAAQLPGRTDNDIKNYWNTRLKKKLLGKQRKEQAARRASLKQEMQMKRETDQSLLMASPPFIMNYHQTLLGWPGMTPINVPHQLVSQETNSNFMSQESLRNLLVNIGGRFYDDDHNLQDPNMSATGNYTVDLGGLPGQDHQVQTAAESINLFSSSSASSMNSLETNYSANVDGAQGMFQGLLEGLLPLELEAMAAAYSNNPQGSQSFGSLLYGSMDISNHLMSTSTGSSGISSVESRSWENPLANYPPPPHHQLVSEYETSNCLQRSIRTDLGSSPFEDPRLYFVPQ